MLTLRIYSLQVSISFENESVNCSVTSDSLGPHGLQTTRLLCPWNSPGRHTEAGWLCLLQGIFSIRGSNLGHLHAGRFFTICATREAQCPFFTSVSYSYRAGHCIPNTDLSCNQKFVPLTSNSPSLNPVPTSADLFIILIWLTCRFSSVAS